MIYRQPAPEEAVDQGDIFDGCPLLQVTGFDPVNVDPLEIGYSSNRVVVLTQTCDLANDKTTVVVVARLSAGCLVTRRCNLACAFCYGNDEALPKGELTADQWKQLFKHMRSWGLMRVDLSGGEPTLRKDIGQIADAATNAGLNAVLSTNGLLLSDKGPKDLPHDVRIHVSLDSGFELVHDASRLLRTLNPSQQSFQKTSKFISKCLEQDRRVRVLTCVGPHNQEGLFQLGEHIAGLGVTEWNISRILRAGRAQREYEHRWQVDDAEIVEQIHNMREAYPWLRIRYSNRTEQDGYFLLVLPDGMLATQYTDSRDKVCLGKAIEMRLDDLRNHPGFDLASHGRKWIAATVELQPIL
jgi:molybdenum cofactor biosynthesis enzyme MoaA